MVMIRALAERTNSPGPVPQLAENNLQLLKRVVQSEEREIANVDKEGAEGFGGAVAGSAGMVANIMADMQKAGPPPRVLAPEVAAEAQDIASAMLSFLEWSSDTRTASDSDASERSDHEVSDDDASASPEEVGEEGDGAALLLALQRGAPPDATSPLETEAATPQKRRGVADRASHFYCRHPECGKSYGCPDAVRKHCRKKHSDWLKKLGAASGPSGYCRWD